MRHPSLIHLAIILGIVALWSPCSAQSWTAEDDAVAIEGGTGLSKAVLKLDTTKQADTGSLRCGPLEGIWDPRFMNLRLRAEGTIQAGGAMRVSVLFSAVKAFPEKPADLLGSSDHLLRGTLSGYQHINPSSPRLKRGGPTVQSLWLEISPSVIGRDGKPAAAAMGRLQISEIEVLGAHIRPKSSSRERRADYLKYAGRRALAEAPSRKPNANALRLPGLLAALIEARDPLDPRVGHFFNESRKIIESLQSPGNRLGPFEIFLPIATYTCATHLNHIDVLKNPGFADYRQAVLKHQSLWPDYRSNGVAPTPRPIPRTKSPADVTERIDNGNFRLLVTAAGFLSAQEFPELKTTWQAGNKPAITYDNSDIRREMNHYLRRVYHSIATRNTTESGSTIYMALNFAAIRTVANHARDPEIKRIATETLDLLYTTLAASYNQGFFVASSARSKGDFLGAEGATGFVGWLEFPSTRHARAATTPFNVFNAMPGDYRVPPWVTPQDGRPMVRRETFGTYNKAFGYTWHSRNYSLTSAIEQTGDKLGNPRWDNNGFYKEYSRHKLNWFGPTPGAFSPQWENSAQAYGSRRNQRNGAFYGTNPYSLVQQYRGTQIGLADVRVGYPFRKMYVSWDRAIRLRIDDPSGWHLCHTGGMMFAFRPLKPPTAKGVSGWAGGNYDEFDYKKTAWLLETAESPGSKERSTETLRKELEGLLERLRNAAPQASHLDDADPKPPVLNYTSPLSGKTLSIDASLFPLTADGEGMAIADYPLLATYPIDEARPRVVHEKGVFRVLDADGREVLRRSFDDWTSKNAGN